MNTNTNVNTVIQTLTSTTIPSIGTLLDKKKKLAITSPAFSDSGAKEQQVLPQNQFTGANSGVLSSIIDTSNTKEMSARKRTLERKSKDQGLTSEEEKELQMLTEKFSNTTRAPKNLQNKMPHELCQNRKILSDFLKRLKYGGFNNLLNGAISQFQDARISDINFFNKQYQGKDFNEAFSDELKEIFSSAFDKTDLETDSTKWAASFKSKLKEINTKPSEPKNAFEDAKTNEENNQNFEYNLKLLILAKTLSQSAKGSNNNRFFYFDQNAAQRTFDVCKDLMNSLNNQDIEKFIDTFLETYQANLRTALFQDCKQLEIEDENGNVVGKVYDIEQLNGEQAHDDLQVRQLQNIAAESWCTCHAGYARGYLSEANSFIFIPNKGNRILRIEAKIEGNNLNIMSVTNFENGHQNDDYLAHFCWIKDDEDIGHLFNFISKMQKDKNYDISLKAVFDIFSTSSTNKTRILEYNKEKFDKYDSQLSEFEQNPNIDAVMQILINTICVPDDYLYKYSKNTKVSILKRCLNILNEHKDEIKTDKVIKIFNDINMIYTQTNTDVGSHVLEGQIMEFSIKFLSSHINELKEGEVIEILKKVKNINTNYDTVEYETNVIDAKKEFINISINCLKNQIQDLKQNPEPDRVVNILDVLSRINKIDIDKDSKEIYKEEILTCLGLLSGRLPKLRIQSINIDELNNSHIKEILDIHLNNLKNINLPNLEKADYINLNEFKGNKIEFQNLKEARFLDFKYIAPSTTINFPNLEKIADTSSNGIELSTFKSFSIPKLQELPKLNLSIESVDGIGDFDINPNLQIDTLEIQSSKLFDQPWNSKTDKQVFLKNTLSGNKELLTKLKEIFKHSDRISISQYENSKESDKLVLTKDEVQKILEEAGIE